MLKKDFDKYGTLDSVREFMFQKMDKEEDVVISHLDSGSRIYGKILSVGADSIVLLMRDGGHSTIFLERVTDFE